MKPRLVPARHSLLPGAALARSKRDTFDVLTGLLPSLRLAPGYEPRVAPNVSFRGPLTPEVEWDA